MHSYKSLIRHHIDKSSCAITAFMSGHHLVTQCMVITKNYLLFIAGDSKEKEYNSNMALGYNWLRCNAIRNAASVLNNPITSKTILLMKYTGFIMIDKNNSNNCYYFMKINNNRGDVINDLYSQYTFNVDKCSNNTKGNIICNCCQSMLKSFQRKCLDLRIT